MVYCRSSAARYLAAPLHQHARGVGARHSITLRVPTNKVQPMQAAYTPHTPFGSRRPRSRTARRGSGW